MSAKLAVSIGLLVLLSTASDAFAFGSIWGGGGGDGQSGGSFGQQVVINTEEDNPNRNGTSVPEPSSLYAVGTALVLLGGAGWLLRRK